MFFTQHGKPWSNPTSDTEKAELSHDHDVAHLQTKAIQMTFMWREVIWWSLFLQRLQVNMWQLFCLPYDFTPILSVECLQDVIFYWKPPLRLGSMLLIVPGHQAQYENVNYD